MDAVPPNPRGPLMIHVTKILYPTDFSSYSNQAYFHAVGLAETYGASLTVVYVHTPGAAGDKAHWRSQLEQVRPANPNIAVRHVLLEGDPATEIARYATDAGIDVIVIGTRGRTGADRLELGSVAERVMREAPCSVLVVKLPKGLTGAERPVAAAAAPARA
ncbi:universal stress protein [Frigoriglobus tundricola]|uniref:Universal stress protein n=1 Tax=Frigoriglobus tundricola TaxID=2774151 RepID=A0A6M5YPY0_9BACT|nr:universal stress protein [Frigoriglobus tundricola]QJW96045.1 Putative universal stress protein [Frigoriglobus tundricola]